MTKDARDVCAYPGCTNELHIKNSSGVCRQHNHRRPYCQCVQCQYGAAAYTRRMQSAEEDRKKVELNMPPSTTGLHRERKVAVTLSKAPWE